jgi:hypothetical protein
MLATISAESSETRQLRMAIVGALVFRSLVHAFLGASLLGSCKNDVWCIGERLRFFPLILGLSVAVPRAQGLRTYGKSMLALYA